MITLNASANVSVRRENWKNTFLSPGINRGSKFVASACGVVAPKQIVRSQNGLFIWRLIESDRFLTMFEEHLLKCLKVIRALPIYCRDLRSHLKWLFILLPLGQSTWNSVYYFIFVNYTQIVILLLPTFTLR